VTRRPGDPLHLFVHLQKTGGIALFRRMRDSFGTAAVYPLPDHQAARRTSVGVDLMLERVAAMGDEVEVVTGHFPLCVAELLPQPVRTFTVLREPVERTLSFLRHQTILEERFADTPLDRIYDDEANREGLIRNHMVRMLSLTTDEMTDGALTRIPHDRAHLELAKRNLAERIDVMGVQEEFDAFVDLLQATFGWDLGPPQFANRTTPAEAPDGLRERILEDNALDVELYRFAVDLWRSRTATTDRGGTLDP
jgi:hypothetical protein